MNLFVLVGLLFKTAAPNELIYITENSRLQQVRVSNYLKVTCSLASKQELVSFAAEQAGIVIKKMKRRKPFE